MHISRFSGKGEDALFQSVAPILYLRRSVSPSDLSRVVKRRHCILIAAPINIILSHIETELTESMEKRDRIVAAGRDRSPVIIRMHSFNTETQMMIMLHDDAERGPASDDCSPLF